MAQDFIKLTHPDQLGFTSIKKEVFNSIAFIACLDEKLAVCEKKSKNIFQKNFSGTFVHPFEEYNPPGNYRPSIPSIQNESSA